MASSTTARTRRNMPAACLAAALAAGLVLTGAGSAPVSHAANAPDAPAPAAPSKASAAVIDALARHETPSVLVRFRGRADLSAASTLRDREQRARFVFDALNTQAERSQSRVLQRLRSGYGLSQDRNDFQMLWIANTLAIRRLTQDLLAELEASPDVERIEVEEVIEAPVVDGTPLSGPHTQAAVSSLARVKAPDVWALGYRGDGIVVANIDTGVLYTHESLVGNYRGNLGGGSFNHTYNWFDPYTFSATPRTTGPHGSHTMGTIAGDDGDAFQIGAAPGAQWVNCIGFGGHNGSATTASLLRCGEWMIAPTNTVGAAASANPAMRVDIVSNSWTSCTRTHLDFYDAMIEAWHAAGIMPVFAAGNTSNCNYATDPPLNTVGAPGSSGLALTVGSTGNSNGQYATHSNKGPTTDPAPGLPFSAETFGFPDLKPNVVAPGVDVVSAYDSGDDVYGTMTGTSMSTPLAAGIVALMWDAAPCLRGNVARTGTLLMQSATRIARSTGSPSDGPGNIPNQATGWGEVNALAAVQAAQDFCANGAAPALSVGFARNEILLEETVRLDVFLSSHRGGDATLTADLVATLPAGLQLAAAPNASTSCGSATLTATPGASSFTLAAGATVPPGDGCAISVEVQADTAGRYTF